MSSEWTDWHGGRCPVPEGTPVEVRYRNGSRYRGVALRDACVQVAWDNDGVGYDIVQYRVYCGDDCEKSACTACQPSGLKWTQPAVDPLSDDHEALTFHELPVPTEVIDLNTKPTNPKDALGVRKAPLSVVPMGVVAEIGIGMLEGASKYGRHNYRGVGVRASVYFDATMRHLIAWWEGEDEDADTCELDETGKPIPGTGMSHIAKALCSLAVLRDAQMQGMCTDDRAPRSRPFYPQLNAKADAIINRHADKKPHHYTISDEVTP